MSFKAGDLTFSVKAKNLSSKAKDFKIVLKDSLRPRTAVAGAIMSFHQRVLQRCYN